MRTIATMVLLIICGVFVQAQNGPRITADVEYVSSDGGNGMGVYVLKLDGRPQRFSWVAKPRWATAGATEAATATLPHSSLAYKPGAKWRIIYSLANTYPYNNEATYFLWNAEDLPNSFAGLTISKTGYFDVIAQDTARCQLRFIANDLVFVGSISFVTLSRLLRQTVLNAKDVESFLVGRPVSATLTGVTTGDTVISFTNLSRLTITNPTRVIQPSWTERSTADETVIDLSADVLFDFNKASIRPDAIPVLLKLARSLRTSNAPNIELNGFTDSIGTDEYNLDLSQRRAEAVKSWLISKAGLIGDRLTTKGYGKTQSFAPNALPDGRDNPAGRQKNRRVEIRIPKY